jgi:hypothetical protein
MKSTKYLAIILLALMAFALMAQTASAEVRTVKLSIPGCE